MKSDKNVCCERLLSPLAGGVFVNRIGILHKVELLQLYRREIKMLSMTIKSETKVPLAIWGKLLYNSM